MYVRFKWMREITRKNDLNIKILAKCLLDMMMVTIPFAGRSTTICKPILSPDALQTHLYHSRDDDNNLLPPTLPFTASSPAAAAGAVVHFHISLHYILPVNANAYTTFVQLVNAFTAP